MGRDELSAIYERRFKTNQEYRNRVWQTLVRLSFQRYIPPEGHVLDLGCGYGDFINNVRAAKRYAMDLNPITASRLTPGITFFEQDCSEQWPIRDGALDVVFSSNFFEHLPLKRDLQLTLERAHSALRQGGLLIALGPNIRYLPGAYWDFIDHHIALTDRSVVEAMELAGFTKVRVIDRFLPYSMSDGGWQAPIIFVDMYLCMPILWRFFGKQFLVIVKKVG